MKTYKYNYYKVLQANYGYGWDDIAWYDTRERDQMVELKRDWRSYRENEPGVPFRIIQRRELNPKYEGE